MITLTEGNLLKADAEALVNTVNCAGHMGKGIALQFKKAFPENYEAYRRACDAEQVRPGQMFIFDTDTMFNPRHIINFPTKRHWRGKSLYEDIESGLKALVEDVRRLGIRSIAIPPLGCGLGGLDWNRVRMMIEEAFTALPEVEVMLFPPSGTPEAEDMPVRTKRPKLTVARALFIEMMAQYSRLAYRLTLLEVQKLAYFLQEAGEPLRLNFQEGHYGPYAHNLNKVLEVLEGHYISGYGDTQKPDVEMSLQPGAAAEAGAFLAEHEESRRHLEHVAEVIDGFETPYGMELLSSLHWVASHRERSARNADEAISLVRNWNSRKRGLFQEEHMRLAWDRLTSLGLVGAAENQ
jgi:O-acetyl-ADP-ribose deacetylase (regulator of RNase III)